MESLNWMAWTWQTGLFFAGLASTLCAMTFLAVKYPETERIGALGIPTTRGDRLFLSLLFAAIIHIIWIALGGAAALWLATIIALAAAVGIFRFV